MNSLIFGFLILKREILGNNVSEKAQCLFFRVESFWHYNAYWILTNQNLASKNVIQGQGTPVYLYFTFVYRSITHTTGNIYLFPIYVSLGYIFIPEFDKSKFLHCYNLWNQYYLGFCSWFVGLNEYLSDSKWLWFVQLFFFNKSLTFSKES